MAERKGNNRAGGNCPARNKVAAKEKAAQQAGEEYLEERPAAANVNHKDALFRLIFKDKRNALSLYNAVNGSHYDDPDELVVTTLKNAVYMGMKNDVSFIVDGTLSLYEHQSTLNPNMPLRSLLYVASVYGTLIDEDRLYGRKLLSLAEPRFVTFYNGVEAMPERELLRLSDAFETHTNVPMLELQVLVLNINEGYNKKLMDNCRCLHDYAVFTAKVREKQKTAKDLETAIEQAIDECIRKGILEDILRENRNEVSSMVLSEYNQERHMELIREEALEEGYDRGEKDGYSSGQKDGYSSGQKDGYSSGQKRMLRLFERMSKAGEADQIPKLSKDEAFLEEMCKKYNV